ncbi:hypothetical protein RF683_00845 [Flavobacterium sp. 20NA77.7]|uniref:Uncharacterized protein n=1 Tax=Flavobacterium nakdongensis TaxID=3073563 RepID=A0ABY9RBI5_9FLAO|nr:hypothetical protein [Flavobacterium sp. 20NA77.7]WMW78024.1 hypothetical protein RF683_00845 [Flavobacterium sp. 20NA77.7]
METIFDIISLTLLTALFISPFFIIWWLNRLAIRYKFIIYLTIGVLTTAIIFLTFGWWVDISDQMLLEHYGYDFDAMNYTERFGKVSPENMERVKNLEMSIMGIGWPLKVILTYIFYFPYILIVYLLTYFFNKIRLRKQTKTNK